MVRITFLLKKVFSNFVQWGGLTAFIVFLVTGKLLAGLAFVLILLPMLVFVNLE